MTPKLSLEGQEIRQRNEGRSVLNKRNNMWKDREVHMYNELLGISWYQVWDGVGRVGNSVEKQIKEDIKDFIMYKLKILDLNLYISCSQSKFCIPLWVPKIFPWGLTKSNTFHHKIKMLLAFFIVLTFAIVGKMAGTLSGDQDSHPKLY